MDLLTISKEYTESNIQKVKLPKMTLGMEQFEIDKLNKINNKAETTINGFKPIDLSFLGLVKKSDMMPRFAIWNTNSPYCCYKITHSERSPKYQFEYSWNSRHTIITQAFKYHFTHLYSKETNPFQYLSIKATAIWAGLVPDETKDKISKNQDRFEDIYIIGEPVAWKIEKIEIPRPVNPDPLVIGINKNVAYLIDSFDTTPFEEYIKKEFV